jgi:hypothetical protein
MTNPSPHEITRQRLALHMLGARVCVTDTLVAAARLKPHLNSSTVLTEVTPAANGRPLPSLLASQPVFRDLPTALFACCPDLRAAEIPPEWIKPYLTWAARHQRWQQFKKCESLYAQALKAMAPLDALPVTDPIVAGLLLYLLSPPPTSLLRQQLMTLALTDPVGSYLVAEGQHTSDERRAIFEGLQGRGRLIYWSSQLPYFGSLCLQPAQSNHSVWSALTQVQLNVPPEELQQWLASVAVAACHNPEAAAATLVLQPNAPKNQQALWLDTLQQPAAAWHAFECVWWARQTWPAPNWNYLVEVLRDTILSDRGRAWFHFSLLDPEFVYDNYQPQNTDPLWAFELLHQRYAERRPINERPLRNQMVERLIKSHGDPVATLVIRALNQLPSRRTT